MKASIAWVSIFLFGLGCAVFETTPVAVAADKHPFNTDDYSAIHRATAIAISPDGKTILYEVLFDGTSGPVNKHDWHLIDASGENPRKLDLPEHFEPSGFTKEGNALDGIEPIGQLPQLAIVPLAEGGATQILALPSGIHSATISPDGARFAVLADSRKKDPLAQVHTVVENDETSLYVVGANGAGGGWWCPTLKDITDIA
jgi:WD40-like Beta Propeller Repeat